MSAAVSAAFLDAFFEAIPDVGAPQRPKVPPEV
jgi:hypothetical protein